MGIKKAKRFSRQELAAFLADLSTQVQGGQLQGETRLWKIPEQVEGTIHLKEEDGEVLAKIKLWWPAREAYPAAAPEKAGPGKAAPGKAQSLKAVKAAMG